MSTIKSINPYTKEINAEFPLLNQEQIKQKIDISYKAFLSWKNTSNQVKKQLFINLSELLLKQQKDLAKLDVIEM
jgi:succinate-semialdehyde dehydrogenase/glutarate-semialdehyde dehydrogenase